MSPLMTERTDLALLAAQLRRTRGAERLAELLYCDDPAAAVAALPYTELFELVHAVGFEDGNDLIALAQPEQLRGCLDLDAWDKDALDPASIEPWVSGLLDAGFEKVGAVWAALDAEFRALWLQKHATIYNPGIGHEAPEDDETTQWTTPDGFFVLALQGDERTQSLTMRLVEDLYRNDAALARHTILAAYGEPQAELEEASYRWRSGRLADLGYVDFFDALDLFKPLELNEVVIGEGSQDLAFDEATNLPAPIVEEVLGRAFLATVLAQMTDDHELDRVQQAILVLVNRVLAAGRAKPGQTEALRRGALYATATLSVGLEALAKGDRGRAVAALRSVGIVRLFRLGFTLGARLRRLATPLAQRTTTLESPCKEVIAAVAAQRPLFPKVADSTPRPGLRPIETVSDIRVLAEHCGYAAIAVAFAEALGVDVGALAATAEPRPSLEQYLRTAVANALLERDFCATPLGLVDVEGLRAGPLGEGRVASAARARVLERARGLLRPQGLADVPALALALDRWLFALAAQLAELAPGELDGRFVDVIFVTP